MADDALAVTCDRCDAKHETGQTDPVAALRDAAYVGWMLSSDLREQGVPAPYGFFCPTCATAIKAGETA